MKSIQLEALGQCIPPPDPDRHQNLISCSLPTFPESFMQIRSGVFAQSC